MQDKQQMFADLLDQCYQTYVAKNTDYGDSASKTYKEFGLVSFIVRMQDKMNRVVNLYKKEEQNEVKDESIEDTLMDLANYALLAVLERRIEKYEENS